VKEKRDDGGNQEVILMFITKLSILSLIKLR